MAAFIRRLVSQHKKRFQDGDFDLDLTYITERVLGMAWPSDSLAEGFYRNPISSVNQMLNKYHHGHYKVYNLCSERSYHPSKFTGGEVGDSYGYDDHQVPHLQVLLDFVRDAAAYLAADPKNVVVVHCKAGKGRTGTCVASLLLWLGVARTWSAALAIYASKRTVDGKGVTISSQRRWVQYFEAIMPLNHVPEAPAIVITHLHVRNLPPKVSSKLVFVIQQRESLGVGRYYMRNVLIAAMPRISTVGGYSLDGFLCGSGANRKGAAAPLPAPKDHNEVCTAERVHHGQGWTMEVSPTTCTLILKRDEKGEPWSVQGDFKVQVYLGNISKSRCAFWTWHNSMFMTGTYCTLPHDSLDKVHPSLPKSIELAMQWNVGVGGMLHTRAASTAESCALSARPPPTDALSCPHQGLHSLDEVVHPPTRRALTEQTPCTAVLHSGDVARAASCHLDGDGKAQPYLQLIDDIDSLWMGASNQASPSLSEPHAVAQVRVSFPPKLLHKSSAFHDPVDPLACAASADVSGRSTNSAEFQTGAHLSPRPVSSAFDSGTSQPTVQAQNSVISTDSTFGASASTRSYLTPFLTDAAQHASACPLPSPGRAPRSCSPCTAGSPTSQPGGSSRSVSVLQNAPAGSSAPAVSPWMAPNERRATIHGGSVQQFSNTSLAPSTSPSTGARVASSNSGYKPSAPRELPAPPRPASACQSIAARSSEPGAFRMFGSLRRQIISHTPWPPASRRPSNAIVNPFRDMPFEVPQSQEQMQGCASLDVLSMQNSTSNAHTSRGSSAVDESGNRSTLTREMTLSLLGWGRSDEADSGPSPDTLEAVKQPPGRAPMQGAGVSWPVAGDVARALDQELARMSGSDGRLFAM